MAQNRSSAVMQQRIEPHDSLDDFPTPPWATRALLEWLRGRGFELEEQSCREPAANRGFMVRPLAEQFGHVMASDVFDYGEGYTQRDYLFGPAAHFDKTDWTITNPPFRLAAQFIARALELSRVGVAMIVRSAFLEGQDRYRELFAVAPPTDILQFTERVPMHRGHVRQTNVTATAYCWIVWRQCLAHHRETIFHWIPPCRKRLEREGDYMPELELEGA